MPYLLHRKFPCPRMKGEIIKDTELISTLVQQMSTHLATWHHMNILSFGSVIHKSEMGLSVKLENKAVSEVQRPHTKAM